MTHASHRVALVTGSSRGLGRAIALRLGREGYAVAINALRGDVDAAAVVETIRAAGGMAGVFLGDVTDEPAVQALTTQITAQLGPVEVLVCNATGPQPDIALTDTSWSEHLDQLRFFVASPVTVGRAVLDGMRDRGWGRIVHIDSEVVDRVPLGRSAYVTAKSAQLGLMRSWAAELAPHGITVNTVGPGSSPSNATPRSRPLCSRTTSPASPPGVSAALRTSRTPSASSYPRRRRSSPGNAWWSMAAAGSFDRATPNGDDPSRVASRMP